MTSVEKGKYVQLSTHFNSKEFDCKCERPECKITLIHDALFVALEALREIAEEPIIINDAFRCPAHNKEVGGVNDSQHELGMAADIRCHVISPFALSLLANKVPAFASGGMGLYETFLHCDVRIGKARWNG